MAQVVPKIDGQPGLRSAAGERPAFLEQPVKDRAAWGDLDRFVPHWTVLFRRCPPFLEDAYAIDMVAQKINHQIGAHAGAGAPLQDVPPGIKHADPRSGSRRDLPRPAAPQP